VRSFPETSVLEKGQLFPFYIFRLPHLAPRDTYTFHAVSLRNEDPDRNQPYNLPSDMANTINELKQLKTLSDTLPQKRKASAAGVDGVTTRPVKRRASKACQCCRSRKVRCNVTEHGAPCTNCRLDEVECIVSESRRKKYVLLGD
jgi:Fungal Zn(2)-Cys(6) binuclear cluster domain